MNCPSCYKSLPKINLNKDAEIIKCIHCNVRFKVEDILSERQAVIKRINNPPVGAWIKRKKGTWKVGVITRSQSTKFQLIGAIVWNILAVCIFIYLQWYNEFDYDIYSILQLLILIVSVLGAWFYYVMNNSGRIVFQFNAVRGKVYIGTSKIGITKEFKWNEISMIEEVVTNELEEIDVYKAKEYTIKLRGSSRLISCYLTISHVRREYLEFVLNHVLESLKQKKEK